MDSEHLEWGMLKRKPNVLDEVAMEQLSNANNTPQEVPVPKKPNPQDRGDMSVLVVNGLSANMNPNDFYRILPASLSSWSTQIQRGTYNTLNHLLRSN